ncbi:porin [Cupriavidus numazuensis]|uniref:Outer membrane porin protein 32 n=1 Tax=Cupriavidus numazuensis TaxID=221992 RepID=A0ABM8TTD4_9BURK|nr:porin [Cupriavidus numazuensis]CAG2159587.1 Outer membrane porin protein 32 [Cupriavidus numazuensis]
MNKPSHHRRSRLTAAALFPACTLLPAVAQADSVEIYGFIKENVESVRLSGNGRSQSTGRLSNDLSVLGFRGNESLGGGNKAFFQIETNLRMDGTGTSQIGDRNTAVGLSGPWGEFLMGQWEMPLRYVSVYKVDPFTAGIFASNSIMGNGFVTAANGVSPQSFDRRQPNLVQYRTPSWNGLSARIALSMPENRTATTDPIAWSGLASYESGQWYVAWGHEYHGDYYYSGSRDHADRLGLVYSFGGTRLRAAYERLSYEPAPGQSVRRDAWQVAATHAIGPHEFRASYTRGGDAHGNAAQAVGGIGLPGTASGAWQVSLGYGYTLSKRTELWAAYTRLVNDRTASYNLSGNSVPGLKAGDAVSGVGLGITHKF